MRKSLLLFLIASGFSQAVLAADVTVTTPATSTTATTATTTTTVSLSDDTMLSTECENIVNACTSAGFVRDGVTGKKLWLNCMHPVLVGQTVTGVTVVAADVSACRTYKIQKLQDELKALQDANTASVTVTTPAVTTTTTPTTDSTDD